MTDESQQTDPQDHSGQGQSDQGGTPPPGGASPLSDQVPSADTMPPPGEIGIKDDQGLLTDFTGAKFDPNEIENTPIPPHTLKFDEKNFLALLAGSISLTFTEKKQIIQTIPKLKQEQIDELVRILEDEKTKFAELNQKHLDKLRELEEKHKQEWEQLERSAEESMAKESDTAKAEQLRKELGLDDDDTAAS